jgi:hypothetical protein
MSGVYRPTLPKRPDAAWYPAVTSREKIDRAKFDDSNGSARSQWGYFFSS